MNSNNASVSYIAHYTTPIDREKSIELSPEHRAALDALIAACDQIVIDYRLTWHLYPRFPSRFEQMQKAMRAAA